MIDLEKAIAFNTEMKSVLEIILGELNYGQQKKLYDNPVVRPIFERYGIEVSK